jgi:ligand-binding sensor domain-containing protein
MPAAIFGRARAGRRRRDRAGIAAAVAGLAVLLLLPNRAGAEWQNFRGSRDGLPDSQVRCITEDTRGRLWFGTPRGAAIFDGLRWEMPELGTATPVVTGILEDRRGYFWLGTQGGGVVRLDAAGRNPVVYTRASGALPTDNVQALLEDHAGKIWVGTPSGLVRHDPEAGIWTAPYPVGPGGLVHGNAVRLLEDRRFNLWVGTPKGVSRLDESRQTWETYHADSQVSASDSILAMAEDARGGVWFGTGLGAFRFLDGTWQQFGPTGGLQGGAIISLLADSLGVYFGGSQGFDNWDGRTWRRYLRAGDGLPLGRIFTLFRDRSGNLWAASETNGLYRYDGVDIQSFVAPAGNGGCPPRGLIGGVVSWVLTSNCITAITEDHRGEIWVATADEGAARLDSAGRWSFLRRGPGVPVADTLSALHEDRTGAIWFASGDRYGGGVGGGVAVLDSSRVGWTHYGAPRDLPSNDVFAIHEDRLGRIWLGTGSGVARRDAAGWRTFLTPSASGTDVKIEQIEEDSTGGMWFRTSNGRLYLLDEGSEEPRRLGAAEGLWTDDVRTLAPAADGSVWIGGEGGFGLFDHGQITRSELSRRDCEALSLDPEGRLWAGLADAALRIDRGGSVERFSGEVIGSTPAVGFYHDAGRTTWVRTYGGLARYNGTSWQVFTSVGDGLVSDQIRQVVQDRRGRLWFGSYAGVSQYDPDRTSPQTVFVTSPGSISPTRNLAFVFGAAYGEAGSLQFRTSVNGLISQDWSDQVTQTLLGVPDGPVVYEVTSRDWAGNVDPTPARLVTEVDATPPPAVIASPTFGQVIGDRVDVLGSAADPRFAWYELQVRPAGVASWSDPRVQRIVRSTAPVSNGRLATAWNTGAYADGEWDLRLVVQDTLGLSGVSLVRVVVDNEFPNAKVTSPARVTASTGGDVYTTNGEVHLYFPPRAFAQDVVVTIAPAGEGLPQIPPGWGVVPGQAWRFAWGESAPAKPATADFALAAGLPADSALATKFPPDCMIARYSNGWSIEGASRSGDGKMLTTLAREPGIYLVARVASLSEGTAALGELVFTPRVLQPGSAEGAGSVAVSFRMGRAGTGSVRIFNRSGRLVRTLADGRLFSAGINVVRWDGRDEDGDPVLTGLYFVRVAVGDLGRTGILAVAR